MDGTPKFVVEKYIQYMYEGDADFGNNPETTIEESKINGGAEGFQPVDDTLRQFGTRSALIEAVRLLSGNEQNGIMKAGKPCKIGLLIRAKDRIAHPIVGFTIKDRLGREIITDNTVLAGKELPSFSSGNCYVVEFGIEIWPNLHEGDYSLSVAVADGAMEDHIQCHWLHDALIFKNIAERNVSAVMTVSNMEVECYKVDH